MSLTQEDLRARAEQRVRRLRPDLAARLDLAAGGDLLAAREELAAGAGDADALTVVVLRRVALAGWIAETCRFVAGVAPERAAPWLRSFTRTVFLAGNADNLAGRFRFDHVAGDGSAAWAGPSPAGRSEALRRLLKVFHCAHGPPARPPVTVEIPPAGDRRPARPPVRRLLYVATAQVTLPDCLIHLNHLLAEAVLDGLVRPGDRLAVHQVPSLAGLAEPLAALRVGAEPTHPGRLRAYAGLTEETDRGDPP
ncbi:MAG TPA: DUF6182 family protein, partial [Micromonosporaceae bacterium]|nr:DUF6182 family protein [Micromonosporaceae bacterium]